MPNNTIEKVCSTCKETKPTTEFYKCETSRDGLRNGCKACVQKWNKPSQLRARERGVCRTTFDQRRKHKLKTKYGITVETYDHLARQQGGLCGICRRPPTRGPLSVDHCHVTKKVRGLLCSKCNVGLGTFCDSIDGLQRAIDYLRQSQ